MTKPSSLLPESTVLWYCGSLYLSWHFQLYSNWHWLGVAKHENSITLCTYYTFLTFLEPMMSHGTKMTFGVSDACLHSVSMWVFFLSWKCGVTVWTQGGTPALKVAFFRKCDSFFLNLQISKKKIFQKATLNLKFPANNSIPEQNSKSY